MSDKDLRRGPISWMTRNTVAANLLMAVFVIGGLFYMTRVTQEVFPEFELDMVSIAVPFPGASPRDVERGILLSIEENIRGLDGVKKVTANAHEGAGQINVELELGVNSAKTFQDIKNAVDRIKTFPDDAERPVVNLATNKREVLSLIVFGDFDRWVMRDVGEMVRGELLARDGITQVEIAGERALEISVQVPQAKLRAYNLTLEGIAQSIRTSAIELPAGGVKTEGGEILLRTDERRDFGREYKEIPILVQSDGTVVRLGDIAQIKDGFAEVDNETLFFGKPAVKLNIYRVGDERPAAISADAKAYIEELKTRLPEGFGISIWNDRSEMLEQRMNLLLKNAFLGLTLVLIVLGLFLRIRLAFWVTLGIPISILGAFLFAPVLGVTINMISLFAFIITLGIIVDDAVVVGENIYEMRQRGMNNVDAAIKGAQMVAQPVTFSILTNIVAFAPLAFVSGNMGKFFKTIPFIVIPVFLVSLIESLFILPSHLSHVSNKIDELKPGFIRRGQERIDSGLMYFIKHSFQPILRAAISARYLTIATSIAIILIVVGVVVSGRINFSFLPRIESDSITATATLPFGSALSETKKVQERLVFAAEKVIAENGGDEIVRGMLAEVGGAIRGGGAAAGAPSSGSHITGVRVFLVSSNKREVSGREFQNQWRKAIGDIPGLENLTFRSSIGPGGGSSINVELSHSNIQVLETASTRLAKILGEFEGVKEVDDGFEQGKPQINLKIKPSAQGLHVTTRDLARQLRSSFYGAEALRQQRGRNEVKVMVRLPESERKSEHDIDEILIRTPSGGEIPLGEAAVVERSRAVTSIKRVDGRRVINVTGDIIEGQVSAEKVIAELKATVIPQLRTDFPGLQTSMAGDSQDRDDSMRSLTAGFAVAMVLIYVLLAIPFGSYLQPLVVMVSIPFGIIGAILGHLFMGFVMRDPVSYGLSIMSMFGIVALSGVVVNDSLVLIYTANSNRKDGMPADEAVIQAAMRRFRPILLTSVTTFLGLAPMIFETSVQAKFLVPMALSLGYGILFSTGIILVLVPALYLAVEDIKNL